MDTNQTLTFISRKSPHSQGYAKACLDMVLSSAVFDQKIRLVFMDDGVYQLQKNQQAKLIDNKDISAAFSALPLYDVHDIYVDEEALQARYLSEDELVIPVQTVDAKAIARLIADSDLVYAL